MALSDREQQMLDEIESALNEDAEFTKSVREVSNPSQKHAHHTHSMQRPGDGLLLPLV